MKLSGHSAAGTTGGCSVGSRGILRKFWLGNETAAGMLSRRSFVFRKDGPVIRGRLCFTSDSRY
jgi:hypothetical protein